MVIAQPDETGRRPVGCSRCGFSAWLNESDELVDEDGIPFL
jgi:hypothetical protein